MTLSPKTINLVNTLAERKVHKSKIYSKFCKITHGLDKALGTTDSDNVSSVVWYAASAVGFMIGLAFSPLFVAQHVLYAAQMGLEIAKVGEDFWFNMRSMTLRVEQSTEQIFRNINL
jgi:hypothetical protein